LKQLVEGDLGSERADLFMDSASWSMQSAFDSFGVGKASLQVTRLDHAGTAPFRIKETFANGSGITQESGANSLPAPFDGLVQLDPNP
jgi:hypothetical protein